MHQQVKQLPPHTRFECRHSQQCDLGCRKPTQNCQYGMQRSHRHSTSWHRGLPSCCACSQHVVCPAAGTAGGVVWGPGAPHQQQGPLRVPTPLGRCCCHCVSWRPPLWRLVPGRGPLRGALRWCGTRQGSCLVGLRATKTCCRSAISFWYALCACDTLTRSTCTTVGAFFIVITKTATTHLPFNPQSTFAAHYLQRAHFSGCERSAVACMRLLCTAMRAAATDTRSDALCTLLPPLLLPWLQVLSRPSPSLVVPYTTLRWVFELLARLLQLSSRSGAPLLTADRPGASPAVPRVLLAGQSLPLPQLQGAMQAVWRPAAVAAAAAVADVAHVGENAAEQLLRELHQVGVVAVECTHNWWWWWWTVHAWCLCHHHLLLHLHHSGVADCVCIATRADIASPPQSVYVQSHHCTDTHRWCRSHAVC